MWKWPNLGGLALCHTQRSPTCWDPYLYLTEPGRNRNAQHSLHQQIDRWYCHGQIHVHMHAVKSRPRWPHTWRYTPSPCRALPWIHVLAVQMVSVEPQSSTNKNWRSTVWFFKPGSVKIQASFLGIVIENRFLRIKRKERSIKRINVCFIHPKVVQECYWIANSVIKMLTNSVCPLMFVCCPYWLSRWCYLMKVNFSLLYAEWRIWMPRSVIECWLKCKTRYSIWFMRKRSYFCANECILALLVAVSRKWLCIFS